MHYTVAVLNPKTGHSRVVFDGQTTKALAIGRARLYNDATAAAGVHICVFRGKGTIGRLIYRLER